MNASLRPNNSLSQVYQNPPILFGKSRLKLKYYENSNLLSSSELMCFVSVFHSPQWWKITVINFWFLTFWGARTAKDMFDFLLILKWETPPTIFALQFFKKKEYKF